MIRCSAPLTVLAAVLVSHFAPETELGSERTKQQWLHLTPLRIATDWCWPHSLLLLLLLETPAGRQSEAAAQRHELALASVEPAGCALALVQSALVPVVAVEERIVGKTTRRVALA